MVPTQKLIAYATVLNGIIISDSNGNVFNTFNLKEENKKLSYQPEESQVEITASYQTPTLIKITKVVTLDRTEFINHMAHRNAVIRVGWQEYRAALELIIPYLEKPAIPLAVLYERDQRIKNIPQPPSLLSILN